jgi:hypothetical protein
MEIQLFRYHPIIGYTFIPNLKTRIEHEAGGYLVRTNAAGFRSEKEFKPEKAANTFRILLFGDSFTAADGVSNKSRYSDILETLLSDVEVYNFALPGTGTDQQYLVYREIAHEFDHDLVVIAAQVENIRRVAAHYRLSITADGEHVLLAKPYFELAPDRTLILKNQPVPKEPCRPDELPAAEHKHVDEGGRMLWLRQAINKIGSPAKDIAQRLSNYQPLPEYDDPLGTDWSLMKSILLQWASECTKPVVIMPIPLYQYVEATASPAAYLARFAELDALEGVSVHDPLPDYHSVPQPERRSFRFAKDIHPTPSHHRLLAASLAKPLASIVGSRSKGVAVI